MKLSFVLFSIDSWISMNNARIVFCFFSTRNSYQNEQQRVDWWHGHNYPKQHRSNRQNIRWDEVKSGLHAIRFGWYDWTAGRIGTIVSLDRMTIWPNDTILCYSIFFKLQNQRNLHWFHRPDAEMDSQRVQYSTSWRHDRQSSPTERTRREFKSRLILLFTWIFMEFDT